MKKRRGKVITKIKIESYGFSVKLRAARKREERERDNEKREREKKEKRRRKPGCSKVSERRKKRRVNFDTEFHFWIGKWGPDIKTDKK